VKYVANIVTCFRIAGSIILLTISVFSLEFYITYLLCGLSDMIDGTIARKTKSVSEFGSKLDTVADLIFVIVVMIKLLPAIQFPLWIWIWISAIAIIKLSNIIRGYIYKRQFIAPHTLINKATGLLLFLLPLTLSWIELKYSCIIVCTMATFAAIHEGTCITKR
jgi:CDP-diacylglycerol--glycerol-3-phosphate 3-phosphatidyltransferase